MKAQDLRLYLLAQEWAILRQAAETEETPVKCMAMVDRLTVLLSETERLIGFKEEDSRQSRQEAASMPDFFYQARNR